MRRCSVSGCQSNFSKPYVSVFTFPKNLTLLNVWLKKIGRPFLKVSENIGVCIKHFEKDLIVGKEDGHKKKVSLKPGAVPTLFNTEGMQNKDNKPSVVASSSVCASNSTCKPANDETKKSVIRKKMHKVPCTTDRPIITVIKAEDLVSDNEKINEKMEEDSSDLSYNNSSNTNSNSLPSPYKHLPSVKVCLKEADRVVFSKELSKIVKRSPSTGSNSSTGSNEVKCLASQPKRRKVQTPAPTVIGRDNDCYCWICHRENITFCCITCPRAYHQKCAGELNESSSEWVCPECRLSVSADADDSNSNKLTSKLSLEGLASLLKLCVNKMKMRAAVAFHQPVSLELYPLYPHYIINPMDFSVLEKNIKQNMYGCPDAFLADVKWIYHNSCVFNGTQHPLSTSAKSLVKACEHDMQEIEVCPDCFMHNVVRNTYWFSDVCRKPHPLVWAKLKGFPYWPAKVVRILDGNVDARFFGAHDRAWVPIAQCYHLSKEVPTTSKPKKKATYDAALDELNVHVHLLKQKFGTFEYAPYRTSFDPQNKYYMYHGIDIDKISLESKKFDPSFMKKAFESSSSGLSYSERERKNSLEDKIDQLESSSSELLQKDEEIAESNTVCPSELKKDDDQVSTPKNDQKSTPGKNLITVQKVSAPAGIFEISDKNALESIQEKENSDNVKKNDSSNNSTENKTLSITDSDQLRKLELALERIKGYVSGKIIDKSPDDKETNSNQCVISNNENDSVNSVEKDTNESVAANRPKSPITLSLPNTLDEGGTNCKVDTSKKSDSFSFKLMETIESCKAKLGISEIIEDEASSDSDSVDDEENEAAEDEEVEDEENEAVEDEESEAVEDEENEAAEDEENEAIEDEENEAAEDEENEAVEDEENEVDDDGSVSGDGNEVSSESEESNSELSETDIEMVDAEHNESVSKEPVLEKSPSNSDNNKNDTAECMLIDDSDEVKLNDSQPLSIPEESDRNEISHKEEEKSTVVNKNIADVCIDVSSSVDSFKELEMNENSKDGQSTPDDPPISMPTNINSCNEDKGNKDSTANTKSVSSLNSDENSLGPTEKSINRPFTVDDCDLSKSSESCNKENKDDEDDDVLICLSPPRKAPTPPLICLDDGSDTDCENEQKPESSSLSGPQKQLSGDDQASVSGNRNQQSENRRNSTFSFSMPLAKSSLNVAQMRRKRKKGSSSESSDSDDDAAVHFSKIPLQGAKRTFNLRNRPARSASLQNGVVSHTPSLDVSHDKSTDQITQKEVSVDIVENVSDKSSQSSPMTCAVVENPVTSPPATSDKKDVEIYYLKKKIAQLVSHIKIQHYKVNCEKEETRHNMNLVILEMRAALENDKRQAIETLRQTFEKEKNKCIEEIKRKQWCASCLKESRYACCWNTSYCSILCQKRHFPEHRKFCSQLRNKNEKAEVIKPKIQTRNEVTADGKKLLVLNMKSTESGKPELSANTQLSASGRPQIQVVKPKSSILVTASPVSSQSQNVQYVLASVKPQNELSPKQSITTAKTTVQPLVAKQLVFTGKEASNADVQNRVCNLSTAVNVLNKNNQSSGSEKEKSAESKPEEKSLEEIYFPLPPKVRFEGLDAASPEPKTQTDELDQEKYASDTEVEALSEKTEESAAEEDDIVFSDSDDKDVKVSLGYSVEITEKALQKCLLFGKTPKKLTRYLVDAIIPDTRLLAKCSAFGQKSNVTKLTRAALPTRKVSAIIDYVQKRFPGTSRSEIVLAINVKCKEARIQLGKLESDESKSSVVKPVLLEKQPETEIAKTTTSITATPVQAASPVGGKTPNVVCIKTTPIAVPSSPNVVVATSATSTILTTTSVTTNFSIARAAVTGPSILRCPQFVIRPKLTNFADGSAAVLPTANTVLPTANAVLPTVRPPAKKRETVKTLLSKSQQLQSLTKDGTKILMPVEFVKVSPSTTQANHQSSVPLSSQGQYIIVGSSTARQSTPMPQVHSITSSSPVKK